MQRHILLQFAVDRPGTVSINLHDRLIFSGKVNDSTVEIVESIPDNVKILRLELSNQDADLVFVTAKYDCYWRENTGFKEKYRDLYNRVHASKFDLSGFPDSDLQLIEQHGLFEPGHTKEFSSWQDYRSQPRINQKPIAGHASAVSVFGQPIEIRPGDLFSCNLVVPALPRSKAC